jgi:hypothetical protein
MVMLSSSTALPSISLYSADNLSHAGSTLSEISQDLLFTSDHLEFDRKAAAGPL